MSYVKETKTTVESKVRVSIKRTCPACGGTIACFSTAASSGTYTAQGHGDQGDVLRAKKLADAGLQEAADKKIVEMEKQDGTYGILCPACSRITPAFERRVEAEGGMRKLVEKMCNPSPMADLFRGIVPLLVMAFVGLMITYVGFTREAEGFSGSLILLAKVMGSLLLVAGVISTVIAIVSACQSEKAYSPYQARVEALSEEAAGRVIKQGVLASGNVWAAATRQAVLDVLGGPGEETRPASN